MKKSSCFSLVLFAALFCSCQLTDKDLVQPEKIADYLYEITLDEYLDSVPNGAMDKATTDFGCSAVRNGNYYGRNLDFFISETSEIVVRTTAKEGRHASVGVARLFQMTDKEIDAGLTKEMLDILPWGMFDGINDAGLVCNMNVVPIEDAVVQHTSPNPGKPEINSTFLVRCLLDNCATVDEAVEYIQNHNVTGMNKGGYDLHFMIADPDKTVVVEFIDNKVVVKEQNIMTNFFLNIDERRPKSDGIERYDILKENYDEGAQSMEGMWNLMKRVRYSLAYDPETKPFWKTEYLQGKPFTIATPVDSILADSDNVEAIKNFKHYKETGEYSPEMHLWFTVHNSVYDIKARKLWVTIREKYDKHYEFQLAK